MCCLYGRVQALIVVLLAAFCDCLSLSLDSLRNNSTLLHNATSLLDNWTDSFSVTWQHVLAVVAGLVAVIAGGLVALSSVAAAVVLCIKKFKLGAHETVNEVTPVVSKLSSGISQLPTAIHNSHSVVGSPSEEQPVSTPLEVPGGVVSD